MRKAIIAALLSLCAGAAYAQPPLPIPVYPPGGPLGPRLLCTDLAIAGWNGSRSPPGAPLADNEVAIYFHVRNNGPRAYVAPDENKQWISIVVSMPTGDVDIGGNVLPPSGSGPVSLARGASWRGHVRATLPAGVTRTSHPPARLQLNYAPASTGWSPPADCNLSNNRRNIVFR